MRSRFLGLRSVLVRLPRALAAADQVATPDAFQRPSSRGVPGGRRWAGPVSRERHGQHGRLGIDKQQAT